MTEQGAATGTGTNYQETKVYKLLVAIVGTAVLAGISLATDGFTNAELVMMAVAGATAANVWVAANLPDQTWIKAGVGVVGGLLNLLVSYLTGDQITTNEWYNLIVVFATTVGIVVVPNPAVNVGRTRRI